MDITQQIKQGLITNKTVIDSQLFKLAHGRTTNEVMQLTGLSLKRIHSGLKDHMQLNLKGSH